MATPAIIVTPVATPIAEGGVSGTFTVQLASQPTGTVYVIVSVPCSPQEESLLGCAPDRTASGYPLTGETAEIATTPTTCVPTVLCHQVRFGNTLRVVEHRAVVLVFTPGNWNQPQTVHVLAPDDQVAELDQVVPIAFSLAGAIATNLSVVVGDNDVPAGAAPFAAFAVVGEPPPVRGLGQEALLVAILYPLEKNLALPVPPPTATIVVQKVVVNDHGGTAVADDFAFDINGVRHEFDADGNVEVIVLPGAYTVTEPPVAAYSTTYANCVDMVVPNGALVTCTITNDDLPGTIIVRKIVVNDDGGTATVADFSFSVNGGAAVPFGAAGEAIVTVAAGTYSITEPPVAGYFTTYANCTDLIVGNGETVTCTITNDDLPPVPGTIIVRKVVVGGTKTAVDFAFQVNGGARVAFEADGENVDHRRAWHLPHHRGRRSRLRRVVYQLPRHRRRKRRHGRLHHHQHGRRAADRPADRPQGRGEQPRRYEHRRRLRVHARRLRADSVRPDRHERARTRARHLHRRRTRRGRIHDEPQRTARMSWSSPTRPSPARSPTTTSRAH